jgi:hypothetical protein
MKTFLFVTLKFICLLFLVNFANSCVNVSSQSSRMREVENKSQARNQAPAECLAVFREFFAYVQKSDPSLATDEKAQNRWLTKWMRKSFVESANRPFKPDEKSDNPTNETFVGVWNRPTTYSIVGSRHYDFRNKDNPNDNRAIIDVLYEWDEKTNGLDNQYPGEKSLYSYIFVFEDSAWKLDDIYTYDDEYASPESLRQWFSQS